MIDIEQMERLVDAPCAEKYLLDKITAERSLRNFIESNATSLLAEIRAGRELAKEAEEGLNDGNWDQVQQALTAFKEAK